MELTLTVDHNLERPLHYQLYDGLREAILAGRLKPGDRVPSTRSLAQSLGVSRATITQGYEQLLSEGYLQAVTGSGTRVCRELPDDAVRPAAFKPWLSASDRANERGYWPTAPRAPKPAKGLSEFAAKLSIVGNLQARPKPAFNFAEGRPSLEEFPMQQWRRLMLRHFRHGGPELLDYAGDPRGHRPLREAIASYLSRARAVECEADQVIITNGTQQAITLIARVLVEKGETVALEDPGYLSARYAFRAEGAKLNPIPVDSLGMEVDRLSRPVKLIYVTPSHQFPTGAVMPLARRLELLSWAESACAYIVEDDYDSEFRFGGRPIPSLQGLGGAERVLYIGTFSKMLFPSLRLGYLVVPSALTQVFAQAKWLMDRHSPSLEQRVLTDFITEGFLERHLRRMRTLYNRRRVALVESLSRHFGDEVTVFGESAGMHLVVDLRTPYECEEVIRRAAEVGVGISNLGQYYLGRAPANRFLLGYGGLSERQIAQGIRLLAEVVR
jgi:GntR family transcriptional regulator / MocR family aminotransferase